jgi:hypothetical protein
MSFLNLQIVNDEFGDNKKFEIKENGVNSKLSKSLDPIKNFEKQKLIGNCLYFFDAFIKIYRYYS